MMAVFAPTGENKAIPYFKRMEKINRKRKNCKFG